MSCNYRHRNLTVVLCCLVLIATFSVQASAQSPSDARSTRVPAQPASACSRHVPERAGGSGQCRCGPARVLKCGYTKSIRRAQRTPGTARAAALRHWGPEYLEDRQLRLRGERSTEPGRISELQPSCQQRRLAWSRRPWVSWRPRRSGIPWRAWWSWCGQLSTNQGGHIGTRQFQQQVRCERQNHSGLGRHDRQAFGDL